MPTIKISEENYELLIAIAGSLQIETKKQHTFDDVVTYLLTVLDKYNKNVSCAQKEEKEEKT